MYRPVLTGMQVFLIHMPWMRLERERERYKKEGEGGGGRVKNV